MIGQHGADRRIVDVDATRRRADGAVGGHLERSGVDVDELGVGEGGGDEGLQLGGPLGRVDLDGQFVTVEIDPGDDGVVLVRRVAHQRPPVVVGLEAGGDEGVADQ